MRWAALLCLACAVLQPVAAVGPQLNVEVTDRPRADARTNEINWESKRPRAVRQLRVGRPLTQQVLKLDEDVLRFTLPDLQPSTAYEVRVSHPGTIPIAVRVQFSRGSGPASSFRRALLDVEKLEFVTDAAGAVHGAGHPNQHGAPEVTVTAHRYGAHSAGPTGGGGFMVLDVVLSPLLNGLPAEAHALGRWLLACLLFVAVAMFAVPVGGLLQHPAQRFWDKRTRLARTTE